MTDVEGPLVPAERFSSLLAMLGAGILRASILEGILGAAAMADGGLTADCNMAQAFEIPHGNRSRHRLPPKRRLIAPISRVPGHVSRDRRFRSGTSPSCQSG